MSFAKESQRFFSALNASAQENLEALSKAIYSCKNPESFRFPTCQNYADALDEITAMSVWRRMVFVIDEYPYLARAEKSFSSRLQHVIDHQCSKTYLSSFWRLLRRAAGGAAR